MSFGPIQSSINAYHSPQPGEAIVAPFLSELQGQHKSGITLFRQTTENDILQRATNDIKASFPEHPGFLATWVFIATWYHIPSCCDCGSDPTQVLELLLVEQMWEIITFIALGLQISML